MYFVYLKTNGNICDERIKHRNRTAESGIPLDYLEELGQTS